METTERKIPNYVFEDLLFRRRLQRNLNDELERLHHLLTEQVRLLKEREALMSTVHAAVEQRWNAEEEAASVVVQTELTEEEATNG
jgi:hypothetical protein